MSDASIHSPQKPSQGTEKDLTIAVYGGVVAAFVGGALYYLSSRTQAKVEEETSD